MWDLAADSLRQRSTRLQELVPSQPSYIGASDASRLGMRGVWFSHNPTHPPVLWRQPFPKEVAAALVTVTNAHGTISISDLELAAMIAQKDVLARHWPVTETTGRVARDRQ